LNFRIGIDKGKEGSPGRLRSGISGPRDLSVGLVDNPRSVGGRNFRCAVAGSIVDNDDFRLDPGRPDRLVDGGKGCREKRLLVIGRDDETDFGDRHESRMEANPGNLKRGIGRTPRGWVAMAVTPWTRLFAQAQGYGSTNRLALPERSTPDEGVFAEFGVDLVDRAAEFGPAGRSGGE